MWNAKRKRKTNSFEKKNRFLNELCSRFCICVFPFLFIEHLLSKAQRIVLLLVTECIMRFDTNTHFEPLHRNSIRKMLMEWWKVHGKWQGFLMQFFLFISHGCLHYTDATLWSNTDLIRICNSERCVCMCFVFVCIQHSNLSYSNGKTTSTHFGWTHFDVKAVFITNRKQHIQSQSNVLS